MHPKINLKVLNRCLTFIALSSDKVYHILFLNLEEWFDLLEDKNFTQKTRTKLENVFAFNFPRKHLITEALIKKILRKPPTALLLSIETDFDCFTATSEAEKQLFERTGASFNLYNKLSPNYQLIFLKTPEEVRPYHIGYVVQIMQFELRLIIRPNPRIPNWEGHFKRLLKNAYLLNPKFIFERSNQTIIQDFESLMGFKT